jgi:hypothetical protein
MSKPGITVKALQNNKKLMKSVVKAELIEIAAREQQEKEEKMKALLAKIASLEEEKKQLQRTPNQKRRRSNKHKRSRRNTVTMKIYFAHSGDVLALFEAFGEKLDEIDRRHLTRDARAKIDEIQSFAFPFTPNAVKAFVKLGPSDVDEFELLTYAASENLSLLFDVSKMEEEAIDNRVKVCKALLEMITNFKGKKSSEKRDAVRDVLAGGMLTEPLEDVLEAVLKMLVPDYKMPVPTKLSNQMKGCGKEIRKLEKELEETKRLIDCYEKLIAEANQDEKGLEDDAAIENAQKLKDNKKHLIDAKKKLRSLEQSITAERWRKNKFEMEKYSFKASQVMEKETAKEEKRQNKNKMDRSRLYNLFYEDKGLIDYAEDEIAEIGRNYYNAMMKGLPLEENEKKELERLEKKSNDNKEEEKAVQKRKRDAEEASDAKKKQKTSTSNEDSTASTVSSDEPFHMGVESSSDVDVDIFDEAPIEI